MTSHYRLPQRRRRTKYKGYVDFRDGRAKPYEVHGWDDALLSEWHTLDEAIAALEKL